MMGAVNELLRSAPPTDLPAARFADIARRLGAATRALGLTVPAFRCPPRVAGADRTIRRFPAGAVVSVRLRGRPFEAAVVDMIDGVLAANRVPDADRARVRAALAEALGDGGAPAEPLGAPASEPIDRAEPAARAA
jgi:hypothetical protein